MVRKSKYFNYARPSFLEGMARIFDFGGTLDYYPRRSAVRKSGPEADAEAIASSTGKPSASTSATPSGSSRKKNGIIWRQPASRNARTGRNRSRKVPPNQPAVPAG